MITFNGTDLSTFGVYVDPSKQYVTPEKDVEYIEIPGRNGTLTLSNNRFTDVTISYPCYFRDNFVANYRALESFLYSVEGFARLESDKEPLYYRMASFASPIEPEVGQLSRTGKFTLTFRCHPQRYLKSGETLVTISASDTINNPTLFKSYPLLRTVGSGTIQIGNVTITVADSSYAHIYIDCETMNAYYGAHNANQYVSFSTHDRISLAPGDNGITHTLSELRIKPRWYEI